MRIALDKLDGADGPGVRQALEAWLPHTNGKVKKRINYDIEDLRWMRDFAREQPDPMGSLLLDAAFERHPYHGFKDHAANLGFLNDWFAYREERMREVVRNRFEDNGLIPADAQ